MDARHLFSLHIQLENKLNYVKFNLSHERSNQFKLFQEVRYVLDFIKEIFMIHPKKHINRNFVSCRIDLEKNEKLLRVYSYIGRPEKKNIPIFLSQYALSTETNEIFT